MRAKALNSWLGGLLSLGLISLPTSAMAIDGSDAESPKLESVTLINLGAVTSGSRVIIEVKASDDKNRMNLYGNLQFEPTYPKEFENISPLCRNANRLNSSRVFNPGFGFFEDKTQFSSSQRIKQTFYMLTEYPYFQSELPSGCPDLRDGKYFTSKINLVLSDETGRTLDLTPQPISMIPTPVIAIPDENIDYFCYGGNSFLPQIEEALKVIPGNKVSIKSNGDLNPTEINLKFVQNARMKLESTIKLINQKTLQDLKNVPSCNLLERRFLGDRSSSTYQQIMVEMAKSSQTTITCTKGKLTKKITGRDPKCPAGYKQK